MGGWVLGNTAGVPGWWGMKIPRGQGVRAGPGDVVRGGKAAGVARSAQPRAGSRHTGTWPGAEIRPLSAQQDGPRGCGDRRAGSVSGHPVGQPRSGHRDVLRGCRGQHGTETPEELTETSPIPRLSRPAGPAHPPSPRSSVPRPPGGSPRDGQDATPRSGGRPRLSQEPTARKESAARRARSQGRPRSPCSRHPADSGGGAPAAPALHPARPRPRRIA